MADACNDCDILLPIENISCQSLLEEQCTHCGWLRKRKNRLNFVTWPNCYVVLHNGCLYYFKNEAAKKAAGKFSLYGYNAVYRDNEFGVKWCFKIVHTHSDFRTYYFAAASEQEMKVWMCKIKLELIKANGRSNLYGRNLQHVKEDKQEKIEDDPKFYEKIEVNIYEDSSKFVPTKDYQKKCSIKKEHEDSDEDELEINEAINMRPPVPTPQKEPFLTFKHRNTIEEPPDLFSVQVPLKPSRLGEPPAPPSTPPRPRKPKPKQENFNQIQQMAFVLNESIVTKNTPKSPKTRRRGSYEKTDGPGCKSPTGPSINSKGSNQSSTGGSTGEEDDHSDAEEYWTDFYFDERESKKAADIILSLGEEGVYLVRPESNGEGKVLVVYYGGQTKKYKIQQQHGMYFLSKDGYHHSCLEILLKYYHKNYLPTISAMLTLPYKLHPAYRP